MDKPVVTRMAELTMPLFLNKEGENIGPPPEHKFGLVFKAAFLDENTLRDMIDLRGMASVWVSAQTEEEVIEVATTLIKNTFAEMRKRTSMIQTFKPEDLNKIEDSHGKLII